MEALTEQPPEQSDHLLWLVRHARPLVAEGVCYGASDLSADDEDTRRAAVALAAVLPLGCEVWTSPLTRCRQLAVALSSLRPDLQQVRLDARLAEMDFGCWEGWRWNHVPRAAIDAWMADFGAHAFGGRESVDRLLARVQAAWQEAREAHRAAGPHATRLWVTHAGVMRAAQVLARGQSRIAHPAQWPREAIDFGTHLRLPLLPRAVDAPAS